uniref:Capsid triplex protein n=1 Tax=Otarine gammaherpesvirus 4 TaxID=2801541 RepID=A0A889IW90_9GAMA|nr:Capsid triplex protein [Otarine gammaherpesvirus 4]
MFAAMATEELVTITLMSRLYTDEIAKLQERIGAVLPLAGTHAVQNLQSVGLSAVCSRETTPDYVRMFHYLASSTLAVLEEVTPDSLIVRKIGGNVTYQIKNVGRPFFQWDTHTRLTVMPPLFGRDDATVCLDSNGYDLVFPAVVPFSIGHDALQKLLLHNIYSRAIAMEPTVADECEVSLHTSHVCHMGRTYRLDLPTVCAAGELTMLDNLALYMCILVALLPRGCMRLLSVLARHGQHELLDVFHGIVPHEVNDIDVGDLSIAEDATRFSAMLTYMQALSSIFNLGPVLTIASYTPENLMAVCWHSVLP